MDSVIAIVALIAFYALQALAARKRKALPPSDGEMIPGQDGPFAGEPRESDELQDALAEIREALGMGAPPPSDPVPQGHSSSSGPGTPPSGPQEWGRPTAPTRPTQTPRPTPPTRATQTPRPSPPPRPTQTPRSSEPSRPVPQTSDEFHRVVTGRPDSENAFEQKASEWTKQPDSYSKWPTRRILTQKTPLEERFESGPSEFRDPLADHDHIPLRAVPVARKVPRRRFDTPKEVREAIIAAEILGPPKALRKR